MIETQEGKGRSMLLTAGKSRGYGFILALAAFTLVWGGLAAGSDIVVATNAGSGPGSLMEAINTANAHPGADAITFNLPAGSETITLTGQLSDVVGDATTIDGGGVVTLDGKNLSAGSNNGLTIRGSDCVIKGLTIIKCGGVGIHITGNNNDILGCRIGTDGVSDLGNGEGILVDMGDHNQIGGDSEEERNIISGNNTAGIRLYGKPTPSDPAMFTVITGNYIGTDATGMYAIPNNYGIQLTFAEKTLIGRPDSGEGNLISGNADAGILSASAPTENTIQSNLIGTDVTGVAPLPNGKDGIQLSNGADNFTIGGATLEAGNTIAFNGRYGVNIQGEQAINNSILHNSIHSNGAKGIYIYAGNGGIAAPNITAIGPVQGTGPVSSTIEIFVDDADEGRIFVDSVPSNASGGFFSSADLNAYDGMNVTATATDADGNTSEFGGGNQFTYYDNESEPVELVPNGSVTSSLYIPGSITIDDINVGLNIGCSSTSGLIVQLENPAGVSIRLFSEVDNDGEDFDDTLLDDEAGNEIGLGMPPFTGSFRPMDPLSTYDGASTKGTWILTVTDVGGSTTGTVYGWFVEITGHIRGIRPCDSYASDNVPYTIYAGDFDDSTLELPDLGLIEDVNVFFTMDCEYVDSFAVSLRSPEGTTIQLVNHPLVSGSDFTDTVFDDEADTDINSGAAPFTGSFRPVAALSGFDGQTTVGEWSLTVYNDDGSPAQVLSWGLCLNTTSASQEGEEDPLLEACELGSLFGQGPHAPSANWTAPTANSPGATDYPFEYFSGITEPIGTVTWWGYTAREESGLWSACIAQPQTAQITFWADDGGEPGELQFYSETLTPVKVSTGVNYSLPGAFVILQRYQATLSTPVSLASGWIRIQGLGSSGCNMHWMSSPQGDGASILMDATHTITPQDYDLSLCLGAEVVAEGEGAEE